MLCYNLRVFNRNKDILLMIITDFNLFERIQIRFLVKISFI